MGKAKERRGQETRQRVRDNRRAGVQPTNVARVGEPTTPYPYSPMEALAALGVWNIRNRILVGKL